MQNGYDLYPSEYNFRYFTRLQFAYSYQGKLQMTNLTHTIYDLRHRVIYFTIKDQAIFEVICKFATN